MKREIMLGISLMINIITMIMYLRECKTTKKAIIKILKCESAYEKVLARNVFLVNRNKELNRKIKLNEVYAEAAASHYKEEI